MKKIKAAILGYGRSGSTMHAGGLENNDNFDVTAVCDIDAERRAQAEERHGCRVYENYHTMLEKEELDIVCVITRNDQHCKMTCDCLSAGVDVLVTKPWAATAKEAKQMIAKAEETGRIIYPWLPARWGSDLRRLKELRDEKTIGDIFTIRRCVSAFSARNDWQTERKYAGGYLMNWGAHIIDPPLLLSNKKVAYISAWEYQAINPGDAEDSFCALFTMDDGTLVQAEHIFAAEEPPTWFIQGTEGTISVRGNQMTVTQKKPRMPDDPTQYAGMHGGDADVFTETIDGALFGDTDDIYAILADAEQGKAEYPIKTADAYELSRLFDEIHTAAIKHVTITHTEK